MFFKNSYNNKVVLVTGHTGFKGTWLVVWLKILGAKVVGISKGLPTEPSAFSLMGLSKDIQDYRFNIKNLDKIKAVRDLVSSKPINIQVDGCVNNEIAPQVIKAGANVLVAGSAIFSGLDFESYKQNIASLRYKI